MSNHNDDMDWLYRKDDEPESTRVLRPPQESSNHVGGYPQPGRQPEAGPQQRSRRREQPSGRQPATDVEAPPVRKRKRHPLRIIGVLALAWLVFLIGTPVYAFTVSNHVDSAPDGDRLAAQPGTTILLVGSDARDDLTAEERKELGTGSVEGQRTDTMMLLHLPATGPAVLLSLPRDSYVAIPGRSKNKLNAAYAFGGAPLLVQTVESNTGIRVDGYLEVGMMAIVDLVDAVGGIEVCPDFDIDDKDAHLTMSKGCQDVDGVTALGYVRMRKSDPRGDLGRVERQREVISAIMKKVATPMTVVNPVRYWQLNMAAAGSLTLGDDTGVVQVGQAAFGFLQVMTGAGISMTVPVSDTDYRTSAGSSVLWDADESAEVFAAIASGDTASLEKYRE
ncbi:LCP family glycopolymer transferase [Tessaracoccus lacteus]|uniref:LCP family protein n=1 Tax=Tessaracoccus lacteus TaxID=3041766 RepID=A0ABY8PVK4_9ACTN|nr:LCP family protein [Tessaracoccus sp. T21]WGT46470.1 LCP family protein [Tessaracoccus sp. T21]